VRNLASIFNPTRLGAATKQRIVSKYMVAAAMTALCPQYNGADRFTPLWRAWKFILPEQRAKKVLNCQYNSAVHCPIVLEFDTLVQYRPAGCNYGAAEVDKFVSWCIVGLVRPNYSPERRQTASSCNASQL